MQQKRHSRKKKMMSFSFCFPYLASLTTMPVQNIKKQKISGKSKRNAHGKKRPGTSTSRITAASRQKKITNSELNQYKRGISLDFSKRQRNYVYSEIRHKTRESAQIQRNFKPFAMRQVPQFDYNQIVNRKTKIKKQQQRNKDIDNFETVLSKKFEIPGVVFKKTQPDSMKQRYSSIPFTTYQSSQIANQKILQSSNTRKTNLRWAEQRMLNIQFIIKNKCKDFQGTMAEYYQRTQNQKASFIFVFDSKDQWMKRVLINRGWTENKNKHSKAFHLLWTFKYPMNATIFPQQLINHYRYSLKLTTKIGLYSMLKKYKLSHLQPLTYELDNEKDSFMSTYDKMQFLKDLKTIHQTFSSEQDMFQISQQQQLKQKILHFLQLPVQNPQQEQLQRQLKYFLQQCLEILLETQKFSYKSLAFNSLIELIKHNQNTQTHIFQLILLLKQSYLCIGKSKHISNLQQAGNENIWIVKSQCSSKGAGMFLSNDAINISKQANRLAQKYIENVLLLQGLNNRKFDLRIWILVAGGKNCRLYYNQQFYGRLCFQPYSLDEKSLKNSAVHLTNYSLNRSSYKEVKQTPVSVILPQQLFIQIQKECKVSYQKIFYQKVEQLLYQMQEIFQKEVCLGANQNTFQLFGVDLLLDYKLDLHLLQMNLSAQCEERHQKLSKMLEQMGQGLLNILQNKEDTTKWRLIK